MRNKNTHNKQPLIKNTINTLGYKYRIIYTNYEHK